MNIRKLTSEDRTLSDSSMNRIQKAMDDYARKVYGDEYGKRNDFHSDYYFPNGENEVFNDANIKSGLFAIGNQKLSDDTLIINFTSALGCPSMNDCPMSQEVCYAVAAENRLKDVRRKNIIVQNLVTHARRNNMIDGLFDIAELYVIEALKTKKPIKYIRYNEVGDFPNQKLLVKTAEFSKKMRDKYGIMSMAYTAKKGLNPSALVDGEPIDTIIAINRSREDIPHSENALNRKFYGVEMNGFSEDPDINLEDAYTNVDHVSDASLNNLKVERPLIDQYGNPSIPVLNVGTWDGGSGYYYICPCSFWRYNKEKAIKLYLANHGLTGFEDLKDRKLSNFVGKNLPIAEKEELDAILRKIKSPCGVKCSVCHDLSGGVTHDGKKNVKEYSILAATHGALKSNYNAEYAARKRQGDDSVKYSEDNPHGHFTKYDDIWKKKKESIDTNSPKSEKQKRKKYPNTDSGIRQDMFQSLNESRIREIVRESISRILSKK